MSSDGHHLRRAFLQSVTNRQGDVRFPATVNSVIRTGSRAERVEQVRVSTDALKEFGYLLTKVHRARVRRVIVGATWCRQNDAEPDATADPSANWNIYESHPIHDAGHGLMRLVNLVRQIFRPPPR
jgi:hypothetical protein